MSAVQTRGWVLVPLDFGDADRNRQQAIVAQTCGLSATAPPPCAVKWAIGLLFLHSGEGKECAVSNNHVAAVQWPERLPVIRSLTFPLVLSSIVAGLLLISSVAGLLFGQRGLHQSDPATLPSFLTQDVITLFVATPLLLTCLWLVRRGSVRGLLLWMGTLFYVAYAYSYSVLGTWLPPLFLVYVAIVSMSLYSLIFVLASTDADAVRARFSGRAPVRWAGGFLMLISLLLATMWAQMIMRDILSGIQPKSTLLVIWPLDLVVALPALFWGGLWLWRRQPLGYVVGGIALMKAAAEGLGLVAQTVVTLFMSGIGDDVLPAYVVIGVGGLVLLVLYLRGLGPERSTIAIGSRQTAASHA